MYIYIYTCICIYIYMYIYIYMVYHGIRSQSNICSPPSLRNTDVLLSNRHTKFTHFDVLLYNTIYVYIYITLYNMAYHRWRPKLRFQHRFVMLVESPHETSPWISRYFLDAELSPWKDRHRHIHQHIHWHIQEARPQREALRYKPFLKMWQIIDCRFAPKFISVWSVLFTAFSSALINDLPSGKLT